MRSIKRVRLIRPGSMVILLALFAAGCGTVPSAAGISVMRQTRRESSSLSDQSIGRDICLVSETNNAGHVYQEVICDVGATDPLFVRSWLPEGNPSAIILGVHGIAGQSRCFGRTGEYLSGKGYAVYAVDLPGNGRSGKAGEAGTAGRQLEALYLLGGRLRETHPGLPLVIVGYSLGGGHVIAYGRRYPDGADAVVSIAPPVRSEIRNAAELLPALLFSPMRPDRRVDVYHYVDSLFYTTELLQQSLNDPFAAQYYRIDYITTLPLISGRRLISAAGRIRVPFLIVQGDADRMNRYEGGTALYEAVEPEWRSFLPLPGAGHDIYGLFVFDDAFLDPRAYGMLEALHCWIRTATPFNP